MKPKQIAETGWRYLRAFLILYLCLFAGNIIAVLLPFSVPGSIVGMLLLFVLLALHLINEKHDDVISADRYRCDELLRYPQRPVAADPRRLCRQYLYRHVCCGAEF